MALDLLITLQALQVVILWLHDWAPLGPLNDVSRVQAEDTRARLIRVTLIQSTPFTLGLVFTILYRETQHPSWTWTWLWVSYLALFGGTHAVLPVRNGIVPNTLHCVLHAATAMTLLTLVARTMMWVR
jgi:hypothetical protein